MAADDSNIIVEVAYSNIAGQVLLEVDVSAGSNLREAVVASGILERFPEIDIDHVNVGIFSRPSHLEYIVQAGDRIEIYRPLLVDPIESRRKRANKGVRN